MHVACVCTHLISGASAVSLVPRSVSLKIDYSAVVLDRSLARLAFSYVLDLLSLCSAVSTACRCHVNMGTPDFGDPGSPKLYRFGDPVPKST